MAKRQRPAHIVGLSLRSLKNLNNDLTNLVLPCFKSLCGIRPQAIYETEERSKAISIIGVEMKKILVFGTFDKVHKGHVKFLDQAGKHGNYLIVVVARDLNVKKMKGRLPVQNEKTRMKNLRKFADKVILGEKKVSYKMIKKINPDVICIGYDQKPDVSQTREILKKLGMKNVDVRKMKSYKQHIYKSSIRRKN